mgnify:CR=1 FL=1
MKKLIIAITSAFMLFATSAMSMDLRPAVGISGNPTTGEINYFRVNHNVSGVPIPVRCKEIYVASSNDTMIWSMVAGLTTIRNDQFPTLTGSIDGSTAFEGIG